ncbi:hypothetical protein [uncultured Polaribacter sp.]|uniref:hypothetical protein n=1 Tax=uncultured Polaribacter sp. TaxID=174711 RepID=UPI0026392307|nr:hypothetical protein [uncultured Polaribacter sp.]
MKKILKKTVSVISLLVVSIFLVSCNNQKIEKKNTKTIVAKNSISNKETVKATTTSRAPIVFIAGFDKGNETFYTNARTYFQEKGLKVVDGQYSLEEIITWLNTNATKNPYGEVHIVNQSNPYKGMNLETTIRGEKITSETLQRTINQGTLPSLKDVVNQNTKIVFHASGLMENKELLKTLKTAFSAKNLPKVVASPYHTIFGGKFSDHSLAQPYYVFYPTANSPGKIDLSKELARKYPEEKDINWFDALHNNNERFIGDAYYTTFSIPIKWEFDFHNTDEKMPTFTTKEEIMDWISQHDELMVELNKNNIAIEKYRWNWSSKNSTFVIRGRTTGILILKPLIKPYGDLQHVKPDTNNKRLYAMK